MCSGGLGKGFALAINCTVALSNIPIPLAFNKAEDNISPFLLIVKYTVTIPCLFCFNAKGG